MTFSICQVIKVVFQQTSRRAVPALVHGVTLVEVSHELAIDFWVLLCEFGDLGGGSGHVLVLVPILSFIHCWVAANIDVVGKAEALARWTCDYSRAQVDLLGFSGNRRSQEALLSGFHERLFCL